MQFGNWRGSDAFCGYYPFHPYQFDLFQKAIIQLSEHNAFSGKYTSVGAVARPVRSHDPRGDGACGNRHSRAVLRRVQEPALGAQPGTHRWAAGEIRADLARRGQPTGSALISATC
jgi:hypothetical protein